MANTYICTYTCLHDNKGNMVIIMIIVIMKERTYVEILLRKERHSPRLFYIVTRKGQYSNNRLYRSLGGPSAIIFNFLVHLSSTYFLLEKYIF